MFPFALISFQNWQKWEQLLMNTSEITSLFLPPMELNSLKSSHQKAYYKIEASFFKELWNYRFPAINYYCHVDHRRCSRVLGSTSGIYIYIEKTMASLLFLFNSKAFCKWLASINGMFQIIFNPLRSGGNQSSYILKKTCS